MAQPPAPKPVLPWKKRIFISVFSAFVDFSRRPNGTVNRRLFGFFHREVPPTPKTVNGVKSSDIVVDPTRNLWFRLFEPESASAGATVLPVVVYFHGGGFSYMSAASVPYDAVCRLFSLKFPAIVVSVNYRLAPEHRCPSQYDDAFDVLKFLDQNGAVLPEVADVSRCFLAGDSAGANIAHHVAVRVSRERLRAVKVIGLVSIQPFFGGEERTESEIRLKQVPLTTVNRTDWLWNLFLPDGSNRDHEAVNVTGPNALDISDVDYPKTIVFTGGFDPLQDRQRRYYEWLRKSGKEAELIEYPNTIHAFYFFPDLPETSQLISQAKDFVAKILSSGTSID